MTKKAEHMLVKPEPKDLFSGANKTATGSKDRIADIQGDSTRVKGHKGAWFEKTGPLQIEAGRSTGNPEAHLRVHWTMGNT